MQIKKIGWENENPKVPHVLLSKAERNNQGVDIGRVVKVNKKYSDGENTAVASVMARVDRIFREYIGEDNVCMVNSVLAKKLEVNEKDKVYVTDDVTESELKEFYKNVQDLMFFGF